MSAYGLAKATSRIWQLYVEQGKLYDIPQNYTVRIGNECRYEEVDGNCPDCFKYNLCRKIAFLEPLTNSTRNNVNKTDVEFYFKLLPKQPQV